MIRNKLIRNLFFAVAAVAVVLIGIYAYYGGYSRVEFVEDYRPGGYLVPITVSAQNPYEIAGTLLDSLMSDLSEVGVDTLSPLMSVFYPYDGGEDSLLHYMAGFLVTSEEAERIPEEHDVISLSPYASLSAYWEHKGQMSVIIGLHKMHTALADLAEDDVVEQRPTVSVLDARNSELYYGIARGDDREYFVDLWKRLSGNEQADGEPLDDSAVSEEDQEAL
ncbi:hypothetical protein [Chitinivibrio alkaliphilus]|uniref:Uncharacterized protein n=1 Tax=Chitinivibrio alkaliphilus ACht1 TaxID=1313304 RepID=U7D6W7_9BACT|nr:hypothetical protein [Chitinivibrio alkaliphilus]ERP38710.1 hypothetical protein CALK_0728 [Chitinivibrio alkaliphilus ACht1]